jgi:hypothetical protein
MPITSGRRLARSRESTLSRGAFSAVESAPGCRLVAILIAAAITANCHQTAQSGSVKRDCRRDFALGKDARGCGKSSRERRVLAVDQ